MKKPYLKKTIEKTRESLDKQFFSKSESFCSLVSAISLSLYLGIPKDYNSSRPFYRSMHPYLTGQRKKTPFLSYEKSLQKFLIALFLSFSIGFKGLSIFIVFDDTKKTINILKKIEIYKKKQEKKESSLHIGLSTEKWTGGLFSNNEVVQKSLYLYGTVSRQFFQYLQKNKTSNRYLSVSKFRGSFYTEKKEFYKETYRKTPNLLIVENAQKNKNVIHEAKKLGIPVIAFSETDNEISGIPVTVPLNIYKDTFLIFLKILLFKLYNYKIDF